MNPIPTLKDRAETIMKELGLNQVELAALAKITKGAVNQWMKSSPTAKMDPVPAFNIADRTHYSPRWLMTGEGEKLVAEKPGDEKEKALLSLYRASDDRGKATILRAAESESSYLTGSFENKDIAA